MNENTDDTNQISNINIKLLEFSQTKGPRSEVHTKQYLDSSTDENKGAQVNARREEHDFKRANNRGKDRVEPDNRRYRRPDNRRRSFDRNVRPQR